MATELRKHKGRYLCLLELIISEETVQYPHSGPGGRGGYLSLQPLLKKLYIIFSIDSVM